MINRYLQSRIESHLFKGKIIVLYGARQVGKTTLVKRLLENYSESADYYSCDEPDIRRALENKSSTELKSFIGDKKLIIFDEAQRVENIGLSLKLLVDNYPQIQIIATGSSSFELSNKIVEPLTGRKFEYLLYPISYNELTNNTSKIEVQRTLEERILYGMYPDVILSSGTDREEIIKNITKSYLYRDIFTFRNIKNPEVLEKLLQALALQIGHEVSYSELGHVVGVDKNTISHYIQILEKAFIIFRLSPFSRNLRNELKKLRKIYFYDTGIRNALINNFNPLDLRTDRGGLWENFLIVERMKANAENKRNCNQFFWRTHAQQEIDFIEEVGGEIKAFEFKWSKIAKPPKSFIDNYENATFSVINRDNFEDFVLGAEKMT